MPLLDHFHPPLSTERRWESFHSSWATRIADALTERWLPTGFIAEEHAHPEPSLEINVATLGSKVWSPPAAGHFFQWTTPHPIQDNELVPRTSARGSPMIERLASDLSVVLAPQPRLRSRYAPRPAA